ncbi:MAG: GTP-binding protein [Candidatus Heimdallarchaeota archaeon]|nr:GTP-binding protein [Candidatus Heimdallarchaeota archaeon]
MSHLDEKNIELLLRQLEDSENIDVRSNAASKLGYITTHHDKIVPALIEALSDENWLVRVEAAKALGRIGKAASKAIEVLKNVMVEPRNRAKRGIFYEVLQTLEKVQIESPKASISTEFAKDEELSPEMEEIMEEALDETIEVTPDDSLEEEKTTDDETTDQDFDGESIEEILEAVEEALEAPIELSSDETQLVEDVLEDAVEDALEEAIEDIVDDSVAEDVIEDIAEEIAEEVIELDDKSVENSEMIIEEPEEEVIEEALEEAVEDALEDTIEDVVDDSVAEDVIEDIVEDIAEEVIESDPESITEENIPLDQVLVFDDDEDENEEIEKKNDLEITDINKITLKMASGEDIPVKKITKNLLKIVLIGDSQVGKGSLRKGFFDEMYVHDYRETIGVDVGSKDIIVDDKTFVMQIWDVANQERFIINQELFFKGTSGAILVFDVTRKSSFDNIIKWFHSVKHVEKNNANIILVGNKIDLRSPDSYHITTEEGLELANKLSEENGAPIPYFETNALSGEKVEEVLKITADNAIAKFLKRNE